LQNTMKVLEQQGWEILLVHPGMFDTFPLWGYPEIRVAKSTQALPVIVDAFSPDYVHIATEGRLGWAMRALCLKRGWKFTTAYHTDFPGYLRKHFYIPILLSNTVMRHFHAPSSAVMVSTRSVENQLRKRGFKNLIRWGRGVDMDVFYPRDRTPNTIPVLLNVGRVSREKNLEAFFDIPFGDKVVVGDGPMLETYRARYPKVTFKGSLHGDALAEEYSRADCFVFPSRTDTFGLVIIEAIACGTPVSAYPVQGPIDIVDGFTGALGDNLSLATNEAMRKPRGEVARRGKMFSWEAATEQFKNALVRR